MSTNTSLSIDIAREGWARHVGHTDSDQAECHQEEKQLAELQAFCAGRKNWIHLRVIGIDREYLFCL